MGKYVIDSYMRKFIYFPGMFYLLTPLAIIIDCNFVSSKMRPKNELPGQKSFQFLGRILEETMTS